MRCPGLRIVNRSGWRRNHGWPPAVDTRMACVPQSDASSITEIISYFDEVNTMPVTDTRLGQECRLLPDISRPFCTQPSHRYSPRGIQFKPWGTPPDEQGYQGGDLLGIVDKLDYLQELGINALYLNPVFASASNHRYHTYDYMAVDPLLGGDASAA